MYLYILYIYLSQGYNETKKQKLMFDKYFVFFWQLGISQRCFKWIYWIYIYIYIYVYMEYGISDIYIYIYMHIYWYRYTHLKIQIYVYLAYIMFNNLSGPI